MMGKETFGNASGTLETPASPASRMKIVGKTGQQYNNAFKCFLPIPDRMISTTEL